MSEFTDKFRKEHERKFTSDLIYEYSGTLCKKYSEYFTEWFDPEKYNWKYSEYLVQHCSSDISIWFDKDKVDICNLDPCSIVLLKKHGEL